MKRNQIIAISLIIITSSLQADFLDNIVNKVTDKLGQKTEQVIEKKVDATLADEPKVTEREQEAVQVSSKNSKVGQLRELIEMKKNGYITDSEFQKQKALILN